MARDEENTLQGPPDQDNILVLPPKSSGEEASGSGEDAGSSGARPSSRGRPPQPPRPPRPGPKDDDTPRRGALPVTAILIMATLATAGLTVSAAAFFAIYRVPLSIQIMLPIVVMATLYGLAYVFMHRGWIIAGQTALNTGLIVFGLAVYTIGSSLRVVNHWPDLLLIWAMGALFVAVLVPSKTALTQTFLVACAWSTSESIYFFAPLHWHFLLLWAAAFTLTSALNWLPGLYVAIGTLALWLGLNSISALSELYWEQIHVASLHVLLWLGLWVISRLLATFELEFARTLARASLALMLAAMAYLMTTYAYPEDFKFLWSVTAAIGAALVLLFSALALARSGAGANRYRDPVELRAGLRASDLFVVITMTVFAVGYPLAYDTIDRILVLYDSRLLAVMTGTVFLAWCLWVVLMGRREHDGMVIGIGLVAAAVELLIVLNEVMNGGAFFTSGNFIVTISVGASVLIALVIILTWIRSRGTPPWSNDRETPSTDV